MPKNDRKRQTSKPKPYDIMYADKSLGQLYAYVDKELGDKKFLCKTLDGKDIRATLHNGVARRARGGGIFRLQVKMLVLIQPLSTEIDCVHEVVMIFNSHQERQLNKEGKLTILKEIKEDKKAFMFDDEVEEEKKDMDDEFDIDAI